LLYFVDQRRQWHLLLLQQPLLQLPDCNCACLLVFSNCLTPLEVLCSCDAGCAEQQLQYQAGCCAVVNNNNTGQLAHYPTAVT
jgi:hypothetical protein